MSLKSLAEVGGKLGLTFSKNHNRKTRAEKILAAYNEVDTSSRIPDSSSPLSAEPTLLHEQKPAFEKLCSGPSPQLAGSDPAEADAQPKRGGVRAGAGRPEGMTDELAAYNRLPQQPHPAIREMFELLFRTWAARVKCDEVALTKDQAFELALPWTQAAHLAGVTDRIPAWLMVALACVWSTANMVTAKASIARAAVEPGPVKEAA